MSLSELTEYNICLYSVVSDMLSVNKVASYLFSLSLYAREVVIQTTELPTCSLQTLHQLGWQFFPSQASNFSFNLCRLRVVSLYRPRAVPIRALMKQSQDFEIASCRVKKWCDGTQSPSPKEPSPELSLSTLRRRRYKPCRFPVLD